MKVRLLDERGQSIVILALAMVVLLVFAGMAVDVGLLYGRRIQLQRGVDAAALAGVLDLPDVGIAESRADQFMRLNGFDPREAEVVVSSGGVGASNFLTVTAQVPMDTMFLWIVGFRTVNVRAAAVAEFKSPMEVYATQHPESGVTGAVNLSVFGKDSNPQWGDAFMAEQWTGEDSCSGVPPTLNPYWSELHGAYTFRIHVPAGYKADEVQVEILDPDCYNTPQNSFEVSFVDVGILPKQMSAERTCRSSVAVIETSDWYNPLWQVRYDQYLGFCAISCDGSGHSMTTRYTLYYYQGLSKRTIAEYVVGLDESTDLRWVVPAGFRFHPDGYPINEDGSRSFYIDIAGLEGTYGNGFDLWAGPPSTDSALPDNVNKRNVYLLRKILFDEVNPHDSEGVGIWAVGYLPLNVNSTTVFTITLGYVPLNAAGKRMRVSSWDMDRFLTGAPCYCDPNIVPGHSCLGLSLDYYLEGVPGFRDVGNVSCSTKWANDVFTIPVEFYGGYLYAVYHTNQQDTTDWRLEYLDVMDDTYVRLVK